jgi:hypothetical protein
MLSVNGCMIISQGDGLASQLSRLMSCDWACCTKPLNFKQLEVMIANVLITIPEHMLVTENKCASWFKELSQKCMNSQGILGYCVWNLIKYRIIYSLFHYNQFSTLLYNNFKMCIDLPETLQFYFMHCLWLTVLRHTDAASLKNISKKHKRTSKNTNYINCVWAWQ